MWLTYFLSHQKSGSFLNEKYVTQYTKILKRCYSSYLSETYRKTDFCIPICCIKSFSFHGLLHILEMIYKLNHPVYDFGRQKYTTRQKKRGLHITYIQPSATYILLRNPHSTFDLLHPSTHSLIHLIRTTICKAFYHSTLHVSRFALFPASSFFNRFLSYDY